MQNTSGSFTRTTDNFKPLSLVPLRTKSQSMIISHGFFGSIRIMLRYLFADLKKKQHAFRIGFITILLVVAFVTALESGIQSVPLVFLKLAENEVGETDLVMTSTRSIIYNPIHARVYFTPLIIDLTILPHLILLSLIKRK
jgi:hypothetical protein